MHFSHPPGPRLSGEAVPHALLRATRSVKGLGTAIEASRSRPEAGSSSGTLDLEKRRGPYRDSPLPPQVPGSSMITESVRIPWSSNLAIVPGV